ncbi:MAG: hypothetical protein OXB99_13545 [Acidimicrobiaceae bacterium]|nr:hypothetical protein [Acidimicrobiaceae bacterium]
MSRSEHVQEGTSYHYLDAEDADPDSVDPISPEGAMPDPDNGDSGRMKQATNSARTLGKQAADATVSGSRKATEIVGSARTTTAQAIGAGAKTAVTAGASAAQAIGSGTAKAGVAAGRAVATGARWVFDSSSVRTAQLFSAAQGLVASDLSPQLNDLVQAAVKGKATIYDKAMDALYLETHIGGANHRLFDGGHTLWGAIKATRDASPDDNLIQDALGGMQGLLRDVSTPKGLPLATWDQSTYDSVANSLHSTFGIPKDWFYDLNSYDVGELLGGAVGVVSLIFGWNKAETESFASLATGMGMSAAVSANPLLLAVSVVAFGRAFHKANHADEYVELAEGGLKGAIGTGTSLGAIALVGVAGGPAGVALLAGVTAGVLAHVATKDLKLDDLKVELGDVSSFVKEDAATVVRHVSQQAIAIGDVIGDTAAVAGRGVVSGTAAAGKFVANSASTAGRFTAGQAVAAGRATASAARAAGRAAAATTTAASSAVGSVTQRTRELVDRDEPEDAGIDQPDAPDNGHQATLMRKGRCTDQ